MGAKRTKEKNAKIHTSSKALTEITKISTERLPRSSPKTDRKITECLHASAIEARLNSYSPYSKFKVGAALVSTKGVIFNGCNIENASYGGTVCAERTAILKAVSAGHTEFEEIVIVTESRKSPAYPCAFCLQVMAEFFAPQTRIKIANPKGIVAEHVFIDLLPHPFGPKQLAAARG